MKRLSDYIDMGKAACGDSDYKLAQSMGLDRRNITNFRKRQSMSNENAMKLAKIIGVDFQDIVAACEIGRDPDKKDFWMQAVAVIAILSVSSFGFKPLNIGVSEASEFNDLYIMRIYW